MRSEPLFSPEPQKPPTILLIGEDEALNTFLIMVLTDIVQRQFTCVSSCVQALHVAPTHAPDLIIIDSNLQRRSGFHLSKQLHTKQTLEHVPTLLLNTDLPLVQSKNPCLFCLQEAFGLHELLFLVTSLLLISHHLRSLR